MVEEVENGQVIFAAPKDNTLESKLAEVTKPGSFNPSSDLLSMFQMEFNSQNKSDILVSANLLPADYNLWSLLEAGLSPSQPPEVRAQAAAYAMARNPDLLLNHLNDPDPLVQLEIQNGLIGNASPTIVHRGLPPVDRNKPRPYRKNTN